ncbi:MAG: fibronectin type III domain-containing protein, partial [Pseudomonadota bacterium]
MNRHIIKFFILFFIAVLPAYTHASTQSQALVDQGRLLLFNNGNATYQNILDAKETFEAAVLADPNDQQAHLFSAVTRTSAFFLKQGDGIGFKTIADILKAMGIPIYLDQLIDVAPPFGRLPELVGRYNPPQTLPNGDDLTDMLGKLVVVIDQALADLAIVDSSIAVTLTAQELDDDTDSQIDYTDVLVVKGALNAIKAVALVLSAYDLDNFDIREFIALDNADMMELHPGLFNQLFVTYPDLLKLAADGLGSARLNAAKQALQLVYPLFLQAHTALKAETDSQDDGFFTYESEGDEQDFKGIINGLSELNASLTGNRAASIQSFSWFCNATVDNGDDINFFLDENVLGNATRMRDESSFWGILGGSNIYGRVLAWDVVSNTTTIILEYWGYKRLVITGTFGAGGTTLAGTCSYKEYNGSAYVQTASSPFTATRALSASSDQTQFDLNAVFGNTGKSQVVIRDALPEFDTFGNPIGNFQGAVLNGLIPGIVTNADAIGAFEFEPPYHTLTIPTATITIDGNKADWPEVSVVASDSKEDFFDGQANFQGMDILKIYLAKDTVNLYVAMELKGDPMWSEPGQEDIWYNFELQKQEGNWHQNTFRANAYYDRNGSEWRVHVGTQDSSGMGHYITTLGSGNVSVGTSFIEWKIPLNLMGDLTTYGGYWPTYGTWWGQIWDGDWLDSNAKLNPVYTINGSVTIPDGYTSGNIYYYLTESADTPAGGDDVFVGSFSPGDGSFTVKDAPYSATNLYLHILWDKDGNGIQNSGDYVGQTSFPITADVNLGTIQLTDIISDLPLEGVSVKHVTANNPVQTYFDIVIGNSFSGSVPNDIASISVTWPDGSVHELWPNGGAQWLASDNEFFAAVDGAPMLGEYVFKVTATDGSVGIKSDIQKDLFVLPAVDVNTVKIDTGSKTPIFSWDPVSVAGTDVTYRLEVFGVDTGFSFRSGRAYDFTSCTLPVLQPGKQYKYRIRTMDHTDWIQVDNRTHTAWQDFTMDNVLSHSAVPAIDLNTYGAVQWAHVGASPYLDLYVKVIDHDGVAYNGSSHHVYARPVDSNGDVIGSTVVNLGFNSWNSTSEAFYSGSMYYSDDVPISTTAGVKFFVDDPDGIQGMLVDMITDTNMVPPADINLTCTVNGGTTPTFTWNPVQNANHYRIRVYDKDRKNTILSWNTDNVLSTTLPPGYLEPGTTYQYRLDARNAHRSFDIDQNIAFPQRDGSNNYPTFTTGTRVDTPFINVEMAGVRVWNTLYTGPYTSFYIKGYDAQGYKDIKSVQVTHPDGTTKTDLYFEYNESSVCAVYTNDSYKDSSPVAGTDTF